MNQQVVSRLNSLPLEDLLDLLLRKHKQGFEDPPLLGQIFTLAQLGQNRVIISAVIIRVDARDIDRHRPPLIGGKALPAGERVPFAAAA